MKNSYSKMMGSKGSKMSRPSPDMGHSNAAHPQMSPSTVKGVRKVVHGAANTARAKEPTKAKPKR